MTTDRTPDPLEALTEFFYVLPLGLIRFDADGSIDMVSPVAVRLLMPFIAVREFTNAYKVLSALLPDLEHRLATHGDPHGTVVDHERFELVQAGRRRVISVTVTRAHAALNIAVVEDITRAVEQERALELQRQQLRAITDSVRDYALYVVEPSGRIAAWNASLRRLGGWEPADIDGAGLDVFVPPEVAETQGFAARLAEATRVGSTEFEAWRRRRDGSSFWASMVLTAIPGGGGEVDGFAVVCRDISAVKQREAERRRLEKSDPLTGALNRWHGTLDLAERLRAFAGGGPTPAVILLDIDGFRRINERHGHPVGDAALRAVARCCAEVLGAAAEVVRWGSDEFLVITTESATAPVAGQAARLLAAIDGIRLPVAGPAIGIRVWHGVAVASGPEDTAERLANRADAALYVASRAGR